MATRTELIDVMTLLSTCSASPTTAEESEIHLAIWTVKFGSTPAHLLHVAAMAHLDDPAKGHFWPSPGRLLSLVPKVRPLALGGPALDAGGRKALDSVAARVLKRWRVATSPWDVWHVWHDAVIVGQVATAAGYVPRLA